MSLRARLLLVVAIMCVTYVVAATFVVRSLESELIFQADSRLLALPPVAAPQPGRFGNDQPPRDLEADDNTDNPYSDFYIAFVASDGMVEPIVEGNLDSSDIDFNGIVFGEATDDGRTILTINGVHSDDRYRVLITEVAGGGAIISVQSLHEADSALAQVMQMFVVAGAVILAVLVLGGLWVYRLGLRPIAKVTTVAEAIAAGDKTQRVSVTHEATEAGKLGRAFNLMLDERDATEERLRQFVGDASHELRTPLTSIQGYLELYKQGAFREPDQLEDVVRRLSMESNRMGEMVEDLLTLSQLDEHPEIRCERVNLTQIVMDAAMDARAVQPDREIILREEPYQAYVVGDPARLTQLVGVLVSNALSHTPTESSVSLRVNSANDTVTLTVQDTGPGMDEQAVAHAFDRFWRGNESRSRAIRGKGSVGAGLGLSIAKSIAEVHGGSIRLDSIPEKGSTFTVTLPSW